MYLNVGRLCLMCLDVGGLHGPIHHVPLDARAV